MWVTAFTRSRLTTGTRCGKTPINPSRSPCLHFGRRRPYSFSGREAHGAAIGVPIDGREVTNKLTAGVQNYEVVEIPQNSVRVRYTRSVHSPRPFPFFIHSANCAEELLHD